VTHAWTTEPAGRLTVRPRVLRQRRPGVHPSRRVEQTGSHGRHRIDDRGRAKKAVAGNGALIAAAVVCDLIATCYASGAQDPATHRLLSRLGCDRGIAPGRRGQLVAGNGQRRPSSARALRTGQGTRPALSKLRRPQPCSRKPQHKFVSRIADTRPLPTPFTTSWFSSRYDHMPPLLTTQLPSSLPPT
jgi:hypothetical protein